MEKNDYLLIKTDQQKQLVYINRLGLQLLESDEHSVLGQQIEQCFPFDLAQSYRQFSQKNFEAKGFYNGYFKFALGGGRSCWLFVDMGKRYSPDGEWLGYEYMAYPPSEEGLSFCSSLNAELVDVEATESIDAATTHLTTYLQSLGCEYDEYVCRLQAL